MFLEGFMWAVYRFRPRESWLSLLLLISTIFLLVSAILEVDWVPEAEVAWVTAVLGLLLAYLLAKKAKSTLLAWIIIILYGLLVTFIHLAHLLPPFNVIQQGFWPLRAFWLRNSTLFLNRASSWLITVAHGHRSQETIIFAFGLGLACWLVTALAVWAVIRQRKPLRGLTLIGVALALNGFFGLSPLWYLPAFVGLAAGLSATINFNTLEDKWRKRGLDFSDEIRIEMLIYVAVIAVFLMAASMLLPAFSLTKTVDAFLAHPWLSGAEETLDEAFAGVKKPRPRPPGSPGGYGVMPRAYLLGEKSPDLAEIIMMTAVVTDKYGNPAPHDLTKRIHWRSLSYEIYTGRGWTLTEEREEPMPAHETVPLPETASTLELVQDITWVRDKRLVRYTLGEPVQFDHAVTLHWRGLDDYVRAHGLTQTYQVTTRVSIAEADALRATTTADIDSLLLSRYTQLPQDLPPRIHDLAQTVAGDLDNPYDQARALERFLRQYPYSLAVEAAPPGVDPVDYFLFDLQSGYCDYYSSSMVLLARSLGIPARVAVGFLSQPPDDNGMQTIRQSNGHSWAEVYFAGYGWVEFEPTAGFSSPHDARIEQTWGTEPPEDFISNPEETAPLPERDPLKQPREWGTIGFRVSLVVLLLVVLAAAWIWLSRRAETEESVLATYGRFQSQAHKLGTAAQPHQTPAEFNQTFQQNLDAFSDHPPTQARAQSVKPLATRLTELFNEAQYAPEPKDHTNEAHTIWQQMKRPLWLMRLRKRFMK